MIDKNYLTSGNRFFIRSDKFSKDQQNEGRGFYLKFDTWSNKWAMMHDTPSGLQSIDENPQSVYFEVGYYLEFLSSAVCRVHQIQVGRPAKIFELVINEHFITNEPRT